MNLRYLLFTILLWIVTIILSIKLYPNWSSSTAALITLIFLALLAVFQLLANASQFFQALKPEERLLFTNQIPDSTSSFKGRKTEISNILNEVKKGKIIIGIFGMGGIGKSSLAFEIASRLKRKFPDGNILVECLGLSKESLSPEAAHTHVITSHHPELDLGKDSTQLRGIYTSILKDTKEVLLFDNVSDDTQIIPLIPPANNLMLITSRNRFFLPGMYQVQLEGLKESEGKDLVLGIVKISEDQALKIAKLCAYHPLATRLAASALKENPSLDTSEYINRLESSHVRLDFVESVFELS